MRFFPVKRRGVGDGVPRASVLSGWSRKSYESLSWGSGASKEAGQSQRFSGRKWWVVGGSWQL